MKGLVYTAPHEIVLQEIENPRVLEGEILLKVEMAGICGSDVDGFLGRSRKRKPPLVMGHELVGRRVDDSGSGRMSVLPLTGCGTCSWCQDGRGNLCPDRKLVGMDSPGAFAEYVAVPESSLFPLPTEVSPAVGVLIEPLANIHHVMGLLGPYPPDAAVVLGSGTIGLLMILALKQEGCRFVVATDLNGAKLEMARKVGADSVFNAAEPDLSALIHGALPCVPAVIDCIGLGSSRAQAIEMADPSGTIIWIGQNDGEMAGEARDVVCKELTIRGSYAYTRDDFAAALRFAARSNTVLETLVTVRPLEDGPDVFRELTTGSDIVKAALSLDI